MVMTYHWGKAGKGSINVNAWLKTGDVILNIELGRSSGHPQYIDFTSVIPPLQIYPLLVLRILGQMEQHK